MTLLKTRHALLLLGRRLSPEAVGSDAQDLGMQLGKT